MNRGVEGIRRKQVIRLWLSVNHLKPLDTWY